MKKTEFSDICFLKMKANMEQIIFVENEIEMP